MRKISYKMKNKDKLMYEHTHMDENLHQMAFADKVEETSAESFKNDRTLDLGLTATDSWVHKQENSRLFY